MSVFHACSTTNSHFLRSFKLIQHTCPSSVDNTDTLSGVLKITHWDDSKSVSRDKSQKPLVHFDLV